MHTHTYRQMLSPPEFQMIMKHNLTEVTFTVPKYNFETKLSTCSLQMKSLAREKDLVLQRFSASMGRNEGSL
jgi:hypothetical protein